MSNAAIELDPQSRGDVDRPPLLLLHALGSSLAMWDAQVAALEPYFHLVRYSLRGHGASARAGVEESDIAALAADACAVLDRLGIERAHWCGLSLGGMVAMRAAIHTPGRVDRLVLANTAAHMPPAAAWSERMALVRHGGMEPLAEPTMARWFTPAFRQRAPCEVGRIRKIFLGTDPASYAAACAAIRDLDLREGLPSIRSRTLVIAGTDDPTAPPPAALAMAAAIPGARCVELPAAHLSGLGAAAAFNATVLGFLA